MSLVSSLLNSASALTAFDRVLTVAQNNVVNASTPGYAKQRISLESQPFDPAAGYSGGVRASDIENSRDEYAEHAVRHQNSLLGETSQNVNTLTAIQSNFDISGSTGIADKLSKLFQAFSAWGQSPNSANAAQTVIDSAVNLGHAFQSAARDLTQVEQDTDNQLHQTVDSINQLTEQLAQYNAETQASTINDPSLDARVFSTLEELSQYAGITATRQADRSYTVLLNGQVPLVLGDRQYALSLDYVQPTTPPPTNTTAPPVVHVYGADGADLNDKITTGKLGALLNERNTVLPSYLGDAYQAGDLNTLAKEFASRVNQLLVHGTSTDPTVTSGGVALFTFDLTNDTNVAQTLAVDPAVLASDLVANDPATGNTNGIALALAKLENPAADADKVGGRSYTEYYGDMAARAGRDLSTATTDQQVRQSTLAQAQNLRQQSSGVDLNEEAITLVQCQMAYEAASRVVTVLDHLTETLVNILAAR